MPEWVVLLEAAGDATHEPISAGEVRRLLRTLDPGPSGAALHSPDRYALQLAATGATPVEALVEVATKWSTAVRQMGLPAWELARTEVLTPEDLQEELRRAAHDEERLVDSAESAPGSYEQSDAGDELLRRAFSDPLTGLLGRQAFVHRLEAALDDSRPARAVAVVLVDLDDFRRVNDVVGGAAADEVLIAVGQRLAAILRPGDTLARLGGDEYGVLMEDGTEEAALAVAERMLDAVRRPIAISGQELTLSARAGAAVGQPGESAEALMANAGAALGAAKGGRGGGLVLCGSDVSHRASRRRDVPTAVLQDRLAHLQLLQQAAVAANEADTLHEAAEVVMRRICTLLGCTVAHLWVLPVAVSGEVPHAPVWHIVGAGRRRELQETTEKVVAAPGVGLRDRALASGRPQWISDLTQDNDLFSGDQPAGVELQSAFAFPVVVGSDAVAVLSFLSRTPMEHTGSFDDVVAAIGTQLGRVVERQRAGEALRRAAEQLRESEARLREAQRLAGLGSWHFDLRSGEASWSQGMYDLYLLEPGQPLDLGSALAAVHPRDRSRVDAALSRLVETGEPTTEEFRTRRADGQMRWHRSHGSAIRDDDGAVVAIHGTAQDITEAKAAEEALRERERRLAEAQRAAALGWWERDLSSGQLTWSDEMCRLWGWPEGDDVDFDTFLATVHPDDRKTVEEEAARLRETGEAVALDFRAVVGGGAERWFRGGAHLLRDEDGTAVKLFGTAQDISEQKRVENDLRATKALYERIVETANEGIVTVDAQNVITFVNPTMAQLLGYSEEELTGMPAWAIVVDEATIAAHNRRRRAGMSDHYPAQLRTKDGAVVDVLVSATPLLDDGGQYTGALAMLTDVSAVREAEEIVRSKRRDMRTELDGDKLGQGPPAP